MTTEKALREALAQAKIALLEANRNGFTHGFAALQCVNAALSLPETQGECDELNDRNIQQRALIEDLAAMCRRMSYALARQGTNDTTVKQCVALLKKHDLGGSVVREMAPPSQPAQGGRLVPVEPTPEMWDAAWNSIVLPYRAKLSMHEIKTLFDLFHKAMLAAAPAAPTNGEGA